MKRAGKKQNRLAPDRGRAPAAAPETSGKGSRGGGAVPAGLAIALSVGFFAWMVSGPKALGGETPRQTPQGVFEGLAACLVLGAAVGVLVVAVLGVVPGDGGRRMRGRIAVASGGLYLSALTAAVGTPALFLAPAAGAVHYALFPRTSGSGRAGLADRLLVVLHVGGFGAATAFFHQWARYRLGWEPFVEGLRALAAVWL